jgi:hypothetical protein
MQAAVLDAFAGPATAVRARAPRRASSVKRKDAIGPLKYDDEFIEERLQDAVYPGASRYLAVWPSR